MKQRNQPDPGASPAFQLLHPGTRLVVGLVAAASTFAAGYFVFVPMSDERAWVMSRRNDAGSSGYAGSGERLARASSGRNAAPQVPAAVAPRVAEATRTAPAHVVAAL